MFFFQHAKDTIYENVATISITNSPKMAMKALARRTFSRSPAASPKNNVEQPRLLRVESREEDFSPSRLSSSAATTAALNQNSSDLAARKPSASKLPKPAAQVKLDSLRNGSRLLRALEEEAVVLTPSAVRKVELAVPPPVPPTRALADGTGAGDSVAPSIAKVGGGVLPAPSSGIPRPSAVGGGVIAKLPAKTAAKSEKRLSFPANQSQQQSSSSKNGSLVEDKVVNNGGVAATGERVDGSTSSNQLQQSERDTPAELTAPPSAVPDSATLPNAPTANGDPVGTIYATTPSVADQCDTSIQVMFFL